MEEYLYKEETYDIIGCAMEVHNELGCGFLEPVYQEALSIVFREKNIPFVKEKSLDIKFKGQVLNKKYIADFICFDKIIIELKAIDTINSQHLAQVINYLKCTDKRLGLIINFGTSSLQYRRVIL